jgi:protein TonB
MKTIPEEWLVSLGVHGAIALTALALWWLSANPNTPTPKIDFEVVRVEPKVVSAASVPAPISMTPKPVDVNPKRQVFGATRRSLKSESGVDIKAGNTLAKDMDTESLEADDAESLPIPQDSFLVSQLPRVRREFRAPYPPEARAKGVEGTVRLKILIDAEGRVRRVQVLSGPGSGLNEAAAAALWQFEFEPARIEAQSVAVEIPYNYTFSLE